MAPEQGRAESSSGALGARAPALFQTNINDIVVNKKNIFEF